MKLKQDHWLCVTPPQLDRNLHMLPEYANESSSFHRKHLSVILNKQCKNLTLTDVYLD